MLHFFKIGNLLDCVAFFAIVGLLESPELSSDKYFKKIRKEHVLRCVW
jgi:hypothetical protein